MTETADPAGHGAGRIGYFFVLYDEGCPICRTAHRWLASRDQLVPLHFVPAGSVEARRRFPGLDHAATLRDLTVIADTGAVYVHDGAWLACLWALTDYRGMAERLVSPHLLPAARRFIATAAAVRRQTAVPHPSDPGYRPDIGYPGGGSSQADVGGGQAGGGWAAVGRADGEADYGDGCDDGCR